MFLNKHIYHFAAQNLNDVVFGQENQQRYMRFGDLLVVRVKLFDVAMRARNYQTPHAKKWVGREPLPGFPMNRLHLGYRLDITKSVLQDIVITLPNRDRFNPNDWVWQIWGESIEPFPARFDMFGDEKYSYEVA